MCGIPDQIDQFCGFGAGRDGIVAAFKSVIVLFFGADPSELIEADILGLIVGIGGCIKAHTIKAVRIAGREIAAIVKCRTVGGPGTVIPQFACGIVCWIVPNDLIVALSVAADGEGVIGSAGGLAVAEGRCRAGTELQIIVVAPEVPQARNGGTVFNGIASGGRRRDPFIEAGIGGDGLAVGRNGDADAVQRGAAAHACTVGTDRQKNIRIGCDNDIMGILVRTVGVEGIKVTGAFLGELPVRSLNVGQFAHNKGTEGVGIDDGFAVYDSGIQQNRRSVLDDVNTGTQIGKACGGKTDLIERSVSGTGGNNLIALGTRQCAGKGRNICKRCGDADGKGLFAVGGHAHSGCGVGSKGGAYGAYNLTAFVAGLIDGQAERHLFIGRGAKLDKVPLAGIFEGVLSFGRPAPYRDGITNDLEGGHGQGVVCRIVFITVGFRADTVGTEPVVAGVAVVHIGKGQRVLGAAGAAAGLEDMDFCLCVIKKQ